MTPPTTTMAPSDGEALAKRRRRIAAIAAGANSILLDNMTLAELRESVALARGRCVTEAIGGVTLDSVAAIAATGVDRISVGALTHSAPALDLALDFE